MQSSINLLSETQLPTREALFRLRYYEESMSGEAYLVLLLGDLEQSQDNPPLLRLHSSCTTGDIFGSLRCDCQAQMHAALRAIAQEGRGIFLYLPQEGRGIGLAGKLQAYKLQEQGYDTVDANQHLGYPVDARSYTTAVAILQEMQITHARLMTNNPEKIEALQAHGIHAERVPLEIPPNASNIFYLRTKRERMGHLLTILPERKDIDPKLL
ncbi:GTP cyclohydrolase II [Ktedonobacter racemifer]|jgi:3,4-dihydroxy 2-butanone 4-phosphate synthase/GTP cyclohydrolase II|uniref:GTP cyclohydrolase-2 n=1 Tax=Ktedonobacter racemifer DSM 44963 TaxID=485913 RepID=D6U1E8_KTERA|nr:GTP cyclohydrolase II [Ktedonobacter racemifer]EFH80799.1 GTP cyclohydrolase II [Ktedonobacter racemifer DSM 44963]